MFRFQYVYRPLCEPYCCELKSRCMQRHIVSWVCWATEERGRALSVCEFFFLIPDNSDVCLFKWVLLRAPSCKSGAIYPGIVTQIRNGCFGQSRGAESVDVVSLGFFDMLVCLSTPPQEAPPQGGSSRASLSPIKRKRGRKRWLSPTCHPHLREFFFSFNKSPQPSLFSYLSPQCL